MLKRIFNRKDTTQIDNGSHEAGIVKGQNQSDKNRTAELKPDPKVHLEPTQFEKDWESMVNGSVER